MRDDRDGKSDMREALPEEILTKVVWLLMLLLGLFLIGVLASTVVKATEGQPVFDKVQEKTYEAFIRNIAFDSVVKDGEEQFYCKVIVLEDKEVQFLDESGEVVSRKSLVVTEPQEGGKRSGKTAILSSKGNFAAIDEYVSVYGDAMPYPVEEHYTIFDEKGQELYTVEGILEGRDSQDRFLISDRDGSAVGTRFIYGTLDFYSPDGGIKTVPLFGELGRGRGGPGYAAFSRDGEYLAVLIQYVGKRPELHSYNADEVWIMLFDRSGNELWRRKVDERQLGNMAISEKGEYLFLKAFTIKRALPKREEPSPKKGEGGKLTGVTLGLYDKQGNELSFKDTSLFVFGSFCFSPQADYVALGGRDLIRLIKTEDGSTVFEKELPWSGRIRELLFSADGEYLIVKPETNPLFTFNMKGELVWQHYFYSRVREIFSGNGFLAFSFPYRYEIFKKIEKER